MPSGLIFTSFIMGLLSTDFVFSIGINDLFSSIPISLTPTDVSNLDDNSGVIDSLDCSAFVVSIV
ncbi:unnamed protein product [Schistosoma curassoni]|uniref:Secreted protein n=1 Tax=Schistosoma curassoni TaxID=6186 RepID=A0A183JKG1_9TREM|nr:unnamed protein product [Schistosoma curassoni]